MEFEAWKGGVPDYRLSTYSDVNSIRSGEYTPRPAYTTTESDLCFECLKKVVVVREYLNDDEHIRIEYKPKA